MRGRTTHPLTLRQGLPELHDDAAFAALRNFIAETHPGGQISAERASGLLAPLFHQSGACMCLLPYTLKCCLGNVRTFTGVISTDGVSVRVHYTRARKPSDTAFDEDVVDDDDIYADDPAYVNAARQSVPVLNVDDPHRVLTTIDLGHNRLVAVQKAVCGHVEEQFVVRNAAYREEAGLNATRRAAARLRKRADRDYKVARKLLAAAPRRACGFAALAVELRAACAALSSYHTSAELRDLNFRKVWKLPQGVQRAAPHFAPCLAARASCVACLRV